MFGCQLLRIAGLGCARDVDGGGGCGCVERGEDGADIVVANGAYDYQVVARGGRGLPDVARREGDFGDAAFGLPASGYGAREFSVVRDDQDAGVRQEISPKQSRTRPQRQSQKSRQDPGATNGDCNLCGAQLQLAATKSTAALLNSWTSSDQGCNFSASSMKERRRLVLMPRLTAASVFLARLACSTRP